MTMDEDRTMISSSLVLKYGTRDPFRIAKYLDIDVKYINTRRQKGFCKIIDDCMFIFINRNMSEQMQKMTCAHELGHLLLHRDILTERSFLLEYELFDIQSQTEYEANVFAADLLIDEDELYELMKPDIDVVTIASSLDVNVNLLMIKLIEMQKAGVDLKIPFNPERKFLGKIEDNAQSL